MEKKWLLLLIPVAIILVIVIIFLIFRVQVEFHGDKTATSISVIGGADGPTSVFIAGKIGDNEIENDRGYTQINMDIAKSIFEVPGDYIILDVRREDEFAEGHIPGAINVANEVIGDAEIAELPDKKQTIYVYCRSGNRSKQAADKLVELGYTNIIECGGILDWNGEIETVHVKNN